MTNEVKELNSELSSTRNELQVLKEGYAKCAKELATWCRRAKDAERLIKIIEKLVVMSNENVDRYSAELRR